MLPLARLAAEVIAENAPAEVIVGTVVPVPASAARLRARGLDPAEEIAAALSRLTGMSLGPCLRRAEGPRQVGRARLERVGDPPRVAAVRIPPRQALLVDDVVTTGATLGACAQALRRAGTEWVGAVTLARA